MIKILAISDPHGKLPKNLDELVKKNNIEVIICVGDVPPVPKGIRKGGGIITFSKEFLKKADKSFKDIIKKLCSFGLPVLILRGNMYLSGKGDKITKSIFRKHRNLIHKRTGKIRLKDVNFVLFDMIFEEHSHAYHTKKSFKPNKSRERRLNKLLKELKNPIIISHAPPYSYLDKIKSGKHVGSKILLKAIKKHQPKLVLCGHIHEAKGRKKIGKTEVVNLGCCGDYKIIEI